nr:NmrA family NAD(P)-binding protein [uncultured Mucilaginibacter sp.]
MNIILGASGQVGGAIAAALLKNKQQVKAVVRDEEKGGKLKAQGAAIALADATDRPSLIKATEGGSTLFVLTPESPGTVDILGEAEQILANYRTAAEVAGIKRIVGLSSMGAQHKEGTGTLKVSYLLEHAFDGLNIDTTFVRPAYYFSNWLPGLKEAQETSILHTFFPVDMALPMISPMDVAKVIADIIADTKDTAKINEVEGPEYYTSADVAAAGSKIMGKTIKAEQIPHAQWEQALQKMGMKPDGIKNFIEMTDAVIAGKAKPEHGVTAPLKGETTLQQYIAEAVKQQNA